MIASATAWTLTVWLFASPELEVAPKIVKREFPTWALCEQERDHLASQALDAGLTGRIVLSCEGPA